MKKERLARFIVLFLVLGFGLAALIFKFWGNPDVIEVHAAMPDEGGWLTSNISTHVSEPLHLRLVSDDVVHGFAIGQSDFEPVDLMPGKPADVTLVFDEPGTYTFYCTRWCGKDHWRMRGTITVTGDQPVNASLPTPPLYLQLGIDLDAPHEIPSLDLPEKPSAEKGAQIVSQLPDSQLTRYHEPDYYRSHSPYQTWMSLMEDPISLEMTDSQVWDLVAWAWQQNTDSARLAEGEALYQRDCAACHGVGGAGDGVFGSGKTNQNIDPPENKPDGHALEKTTNFKDLNNMLGASHALLQGKILRGGMGTGMPSWGLIYTEEQSWALVDYLWTFVFNYSGR